MRGIYQKVIDNGLSEDQTKLYLASRSQYEKNQGIGQEGCKYLIQSKWPHLQYLHISEGQIDDSGFQHLIQGYFPTLKELDLNSNIFKTISLPKTPDTLSQVKIFQQLQTVYLAYNIIENIEPLSRVDAPALEILSLCYQSIIIADNKITKIDCLFKMKLKQIKSFNLCNNYIKQWNVFESMELGSISKLWLSQLWSPRQKNLSVKPFVKIEFKQKIQIWAKTQREQPTIQCLMKKNKKPIILAFG